MRQWLIDMLKRLEFLVPPPPNCHHAITFAQFGSEEDGWQDRLALQVNCDGKFHCLFLDDEDCHQEAIDIADEIADLLRKGPPGQLGIGLGQYLEP
jgi:hypothetical protein